MDKEGHNLSKYSENNFGGSKSFHVMGTHSNYFGGFWEKDDFGMIRYSNRGDKLGKKIFLWAQSDAGKIWEDLLTDTSGQYVEIQSGRLFNQNVFSSSLTPFKQIGFKPYADEAWTEYWFPFGEINGFTDANTMGAFNIQLNGQQLEVKMSPAQQLQDSLKVYNRAGKKIASTNISLTPLKPIKVSLTLPEGEQPSILEVGKARIVLENKELQNLSRPQEISQDLDPESAYGLFLQGRDLYRFRNYEQAEKKIEASLLKNAAFLPALVEMAKLKLQRMEYDSAFYYSKKALSLDTYDGDANYYYGISALKTDRHYDALDGFEVASLSPSHRNAAYTSLSRIYLKEMDLLKAEEYVHKALQGNPNNLEALKILHVLARLNKNEAQLKETATRIRQLNPIDHFIRFEKFYQDPTKVNEKDFVNLIRNEMPIESFLELAIWYANLNRTAESIAVLKLAPNNAESLYWLAWLHKETGAYTKYLEEAEEASMYFVFPFREESVEVFNWAASVNKSWKPNYLMALIQDFRGNRTKAVFLLNKYEQVDFAPFYIFKARINEGASREATLALIKKAIELQPKQWRYKRIYAQILSQNDDTQKAIKVLDNTYKSDKENYVVGLDLINTLMLGNQYEKAEKILANLYVLPFEGASDSRKFYRQTKLMLAYKAMEQGKYSVAIKKIEEAEEWPAHLGVGKPYSNLIDTHLENSLRVLIYTYMGSKEMASKYADLVKDDLIKKEEVLDEIKSITLKKDQRMF
ncbi:DUF5107 domain-containing protein [Arenibacter sp. 6A1]|nr:DUF5107 domain-containing protein [Arenibacter sp. 6A1]NKI28440.1 DUF5107 domain-containing protein [Arenibacter sp. 6A1]